MSRQPDGPVGPDPRAEQAAHDHSVKTNEHLVEVPPTTAMELRARGVKVLVLYPTRDERGRLVRGDFVHPWTALLCPFGHWSTVLSWTRMPKDLGVVVERIHTVWALGGKASAEELAALIRLEGSP